jgi:hypothetical protein
MTVHPFARGKKMKKTLHVLAAVILLFGFSSSAVALSINDEGVVGILEGQIAPGPNETIIANEILAMAINQIQVATNPVGVDCSGGVRDQTPCEYKTGSNDYSGIVVGGTQQITNPTFLIPAALTSTYFLAKYDGPNGGFVLFNTADWLAAGNTSIPADGSPIWGPEGNGLSHYTYFGSRSVADGGTSLLLLGAALTGLGIMRRRMNVCDGQLGLAEINAR